MRNLKKILSLALALVMVFSLMTFASARDFGDADSVDHTEAANVLSALGVIQGYEDGNFYPDRVVKRGEMAKIIAFIVNGGKDPVLNPTEVSYNDTTNHWAKGYIEYCTGLGIVSGYGDGSFKPDNTVTGTEAAKMLLIAMGYNSDIREYTGANWSLNVGVDANQKDLYKNLTYVNPSNGLDRDATAQMVYNCLNARGVYREDSIGVQDGKVTYSYRDDVYTVMYRKMGVARVEGVVVANEYADLTSTGGHTQDGKTDIVISNYDELNGSGTASNAIFTVRNSAAVSVTGATNTFAVSTGKDELGKAIVIFARPSTNTKSTDRAEVIGSVVIDENTILTKDTKYSKASDLEKALRGAGLRTDLSSARLYINGDLQFTSAPGANPGDPAVITLTRYAAGDNSYNLNGYKTQFIDFDLDGYAEVILVEQVDFGKVTTKNTSGNGTLTVSTGSVPVSKNDSRDVVGFDDFARGDYVLYAQAGGRLYLFKPETVTGKLTDYSKQTGDDPGKSALWLDGVKYTNSGAAGWNCDGSKLNNPSTYGHNNLTNDVTFYLDACGYTVAVDGSSIARYALATYANTNAYTANDITTSPRARTYFEDGTNASPVYANNTTTGFNAVFGTSAFDHDSNAGTTDLDPLLLTAGANKAKNVVLGSYHYNSDNELVLNTTKLKTLTGSTAFKYTTGNILVSTGASAWLQGNGGNAYMTDRSVVYFVTCKTLPNGNAGTINNQEVDKVTVYNGKENVPNINLTGSGFAVKYIVNDQNEIEAMAVIAPSISSVGSNYLYVIEVVSSGTDTKQVKVVLDNTIQTITVDSKDSKEVDLGPNLYSVKDGVYTLSNSGVTANVKVKREVIRTNSSLRTIVLTDENSSGTLEYKVLDSTDFANVDKKIAISFEELRWGDEVTIIYRANGDQPEVLGVYVTKANESVAKTPTNTTKSADDAAIKALTDGLYALPQDYTTGLAGGVAGRPENNRIFKYTASKNGVYALTVRDSNGSVVYTEDSGPWTVTDATNGDPHFFYITMDQVNSNSQSWTGAKDGAAAAHGTYRYSVVCKNTGELVLGGSFEW